MRYLGIDYGLKKMGLAISEGQLASIYKIMEISSLKDALVKINHIVNKEKIDLAVVGLPESGKNQAATKKFIKHLKKNMAVEIVDETLTSQDAQRLMIDLNLGQKERQKEDAYSAALILQRFLDSLE